MLLIERKMMSNCSTLSWNNGCVHMVVAYLTLTCVMPGILATSQSQYQHQSYANPIQMDDEGEILAYIKNAFLQQDLIGDADGNYFPLQLDNSWRQFNYFKQRSEPNGILEDSTVSSTLEIEQKQPIIDEELSDDFLDQPMRTRRKDEIDGTPSLSIVNPLDVLRKRLLMEMSRRKLEQDERQRKLNAEILKYKGRK